MWSNTSIFGEHLLEEPLSPSTKSCCCYWPCSLPTAFPAIPYPGQMSCMVHFCFSVCFTSVPVPCSSHRSHGSQPVAGGARSSSSAPQLYGMNSQVGACPCWEPSETATTNWTSEQRCGDIITHSDWGKEGSCSHRWDLKAKWLFLLVATFFGGRAKGTRPALLWVPSLVRGTLWEGSGELTPQQSHNSRHLSFTCKAATGLMGNPWVKGLLCYCNRANWQPV